MKKIVLLILSLLVCSHMFAAQQKPLKPLTIILDWFVNPQHAPIIIAQEKGFFKQHGLKVKIITPADPADPPKLVAAGKADIAIGYQPELYLQVASGLPLVRIGTLVNSPLRAVATLRDSDIHSLADLKGKTIGYSMAGVGDAILSTMLKYNGINIKDVKLVDVHYNLVQALLSHRVAAISGVERNFEIPELALIHHPARAFYPENNGVPPFDALVFLANRHEVHHDPRFLLAFMKAIQEGVNYLHQHPRTSWKLLLKHHPELNNALNKKAWEITLPYFDPHPLKLNKKRYISFAKWMLQHKLITKTLPMRDYAVDIRK